MFKAIICHCQPTISLLKIFLANMNSLMWGPHCPPWILLILFVSRRPQYILIAQHHAIFYTEPRHSRRSGKLIFLVFFYRPQWLIRITAILEEYLDTMVPRTTVWFVFDVMTVVRSVMGFNYDGKQIRFLRYLDDEGQSCQGIDKLIL